jgi:hypothetical protein
MLDGNSLRKCNIIPKHNRMAIIKKVILKLISIFAFANMSKNNLVKP